jgi:hypothetical protein
MKEWHFNVLFFVGVLGAVAMLLGPEIGLDIGKNPTAVTGVGAILTYVLTQKKALTRPPPSDNEQKTDKKKPNHQEEEDGS